MPHTIMTNKSVKSAIRKTFSLTLLSAAFALPTYAQKTTDLGAGGGGTAHVKTEWVVAPANIAIEYGRPTLKGRKELDVMRKDDPTVWRTGADVATIIHTDKSLKFGTVTLAPGSYTINTNPADAGFEIIFGKLESPKQWGVPYKKELEIGRAPMTTRATAAPVEQLTILVEPGKSAGVLKVEWGTKSASIPFTVLP